MSLYEFSVSQKWLTESQLEPLKSCEEAHLFELLLRHCPVPEETLLDTLGAEFGFLVKQGEGVCADPALLKDYDHQWMMQTGIMPLFQMGQTLVVASHNPFHSELNFLRKKVDKLEIWQLNRYALLQILSPAQGRDALLASLLDSAIERKASDIVVHATEKGGALKLRVDGTLIPIRSLTNADLKRLVQLIKLEAHLDVGEAQKPQDGRIEHTVGDVIYEGRVSLIPTLYGEDAVIRLFYANQTCKPLNALGFLEEPLRAMNAMLSERSGLILVTGPTGSGKTTTLYSMLRQLSEDRTKSIVSLEDPIESHLPGIRQSQVNPEKDYTYAEGLKSMLRQDPDVLMIGEIRDAKTAHLVLEAAYTGHLVLSTLHTGSVMASLLRFVSFGCDPFMLRYALKGVISQTLSPKKCHPCEGRGCLQCDFKGVSGRMLLSEVLHLPEPVSVNTDPAKWIEEGLFYAYKADEIAKQNLGWI